MVDKLVNKIYLVVSALPDQGGVANYFNSILPHLGKNVISFEVGSINAKGQGTVFHRLTDQLRFRKVLSSGRPRLIHLNISLNLKAFIRDGLFAWQAKQKGVPLLVFWHGWDSDFATVVEKHLLWFFRGTFGHADVHIVLGSEFEKKLRMWGVAAPIHLCTTVVDERLLNGFEIAKKIERIKKSTEIRILFLARLLKAKGIYETIDALMILLHQGKSVSLSIAGDGPLQKELEGYIAGLDILKGKISFLGYVRDKEKIRAFSEHDIYCLPSYYPEGLPCSVLEAMAFGMPVVTSPVAGIKDLFKNGEMGCLCDPTNPYEIAESINKIILDKKKLCEISIYNHNYAKKYFMAPVVAENLMDVYRQTLS